MRKNPELGSDDNAVLAVVAKLVDGLNRAISSNNFEGRVFSSPG